MRTLDWIVVLTYLAWVVFDGVKRARGTDRLEGYFLADRNLPWWAVGLSVMATQLSAITLVGTTGQGYADGMRFVQFYFGLPFAMVILCFTAVPLFWKARVFTAYEYLERRFDARTRTLASLLFLASRGLSCGVIVAAPAVILSLVLGWNLVLTVLLIGLPTTLYTMLGGVQAVTWTDVKQMAVILIGVSAAIAVLVAGLPAGVGLGDALALAGSSGRLRTLDFSFDWNETYTFWSGLIGGLFLMLSYFGCDQSQVQRYLTARSVAEGRKSLLMSAVFKIPLQGLILLTGVLVFVFYLFEPPPLLFNPVHARAVAGSARAPEYRALESQFERELALRRDAALAASAARSSADPEREAVVRQLADAERRVQVLRGRARSLVQDVSGDPRYQDTNYVFPTFVTTRMPAGLTGLLIAAIFAAAMSSIAAELNSLATSTVIDLYQRHLRPNASEAHYLKVSRLATALWGLFACLVAIFAVGLGSLIEVVNRFGSFFYGSLLGVFVLGLAFKRATATGAFAGLIAGMCAVATVAYTTSISFLWHNVVGVVVVVLVGSALSLVAPASPGPSPGPDRS